VSGARWHRSVMHARMHVHASFRSSLTGRAVQPRASTWFCDCAAGGRPVPKGSCMRSAWTSTAFACPGRRGPAAIRRSAWIRLCSRITTARRRCLPAFVSLCGCCGRDALQNRMTSPFLRAVFCGCSAVLYDCCPLGSACINMGSFFKVLIIRT